MIDMIRIEKAYLRLQNLHSSLVFKAVEMAEEKNKDERGKPIDTKDKGPRWEVRCNSRFIFKAEGDSAEKECKDMAKELNELLEPFMITKYNNFLDEVIVSKVLIENSN